MKKNINTILILTLLISSCKSEKNPSLPIVECKIDTLYLNKQFLAINQQEFDSLSIKYNYIFDGNYYDSIQYLKGKYLNCIGVLKISHIGTGNYHFKERADTAEVIKFLEKTKEKVEQINASDFEYIYSIAGSQRNIITSEYKIDSVSGIAHIIGKIYLSSPSKQLILELQLNSTNFETTRINLLDFPNSFVDCQAD